MQQKLTKLGWNQADLARKLRVHPNTVSKWNEGLPGYAEAYLDLAIEFMEFRKQAVSFAEKLVEFMRGRV